MGLLGIFGKGWVLSFLVLALIANVISHENPIFILLFSICGIAVGWYARGD